MSLSADVALVLPSPSHLRDGRRRIFYSGGWSQSFSKCFAERCNFYNSFHGERESGEVKVHASASELRLRYPQGFQVD